MEKEIIVETLKDETVRKISLLKVIQEQADKVSDISRKSNPTKAAKAYVQEEEQKLMFLYDIIKRGLWEAYRDDEEIYLKTEHFVTILRNFDIEIIARRKTK